MDLLMGPPFHYRISFLQGEFQMKPYAFKCNSALQVGHRKMFVFPKLGQALTYHSDNLKICWLKNCSPGLISDVYISLFEKWRSSSQLCYVSFTRGVIEKGGLFPGVGANTRICLHVYIGAGGMPVFLSANIASGT